MNLTTFKRRSFKTRVTFFMLVIFLTGIRALAVSDRRRRQNMQQLLGERQFAMVDMGVCLK